MICSTGIRLLLYATVRPAAEMSQFIVQFVREILFVTISMRIHVH